MNVITETCAVGEVQISIETGKLAKQSSAVVLRCGETAVLVTAVSSKEPKDLPFLPLTCEYREYPAAAGKIPGGYFKREGRPTEWETLTSRFIDRPIRPLFPKGYRSDTQVIATVLSHDKVHEPDILAITGASAALHLSDAPWAGPIAGVRVARVQGKLVAFPSWDQMKIADILLVVAASRDAIVMVEGGGDQVPEKDMIDALMFAHEAAQPLLAAQERLRERAGKAKRAHVEPAVDEAFRAEVMAAAEEDLRAAFSITGKHERRDAIAAANKKVIERFAASHPERGAEVLAALGKLEKKIVRSRVIKEGRRLDGRGTRDVRPIYIEAHPFPRPHGSALFQRGETQALATVTLGTESDAQRLDTIRGDVTRSFMLHYNFLPFCTGEAKPIRGQSRREVGHGALAERALKYVLPAQEKFPYTIRIVSETLESNGSSSMAAVCGGCLAMMDAGVPIKAPVAGVAMGLMQEGSEIAILSDILGDEDHLGDMDFKVTGTKTGITALQMDIKIEGLNRQVLEAALEQARESRLHILGKMLEVLAEPRADISKHAPRIVTMQVKVDKIREVIGPGGKTIRAIIEQTGCVINIEDSGRVAIASNDIAQIERAKRLIEGLIAEPEVGATYHGVVKRIVDFGAFVEILPGTDGLVHISELEDKRVDRVTDVVQEGDEVVVKVINVDPTGKIRLSRRAAFGVDPSEVQNLRG
ncbi:polyribonucleotide nucleotidyltransferase [Nannocystis exedens]|uniref:Polyribonucleotide nucleotidyltransferase n=1 Tax=Nannocystis exedens TaxID=54 RepID=A0A1I1W861_9BACT|nr:polyribonucleotide nucleotidyltransferase [Nannocystis exedens]PCC67477.1 polyribonucleotide nucleotidyltransferase [Nannocystis exedens]SFD90618.1 polyribonucleotide nucleotidyltransferase [Nannocystis exedens]